MLHLKRLAILLFCTIVYLNYLFTQQQRPPPPTSPGGQTRAPQIRTPQTPLAQPPPQTKTRYGTVLDKAHVTKCLEEWGASHKDSKEDVAILPGKCPQQIPPELEDAYTLNKTVDVIDWWKCQVGPEFLQKKVDGYTDKALDEGIQHAIKREIMYYGLLDSWFYKALEEYPINGSSVVILGSQRPIYEAVCIAFDGGSCTTVDFQVIKVKNPRLRTMTIAEYDENPELFDVAFSISSFEHDGLGRYGDPIRPRGDLDMMKKLKCIIKPQGTLYLSVPIAKDKVIWNMHRIYGQKRFPLLIEHWKLEEVFADDRLPERWSGCDSNAEGDYQPLFVLRNEIPPPGHNQKIMDKYLIENYKEKSCCGENQQCQHPLDWNA